MPTARALLNIEHSKWTDLSLRVLVGGLVISMLGAGTLALTTPSIASASASGCTDVLATMTPGTWETKSGADPSVPVGMLATVGNSLKAKYGDKVELFGTVTLLNPASWENEA